jgi:DNA-binding response OmpR family regulator
MITASIQVKDFPGNRRVYNVVTTPSKHRAAMDSSEAFQETVLRFGVFELDRQAGELRKAGVLVRLPPQPFNVLTLLANHPGKVVTRKEIRRQIWGDETFVDFEQGLNHCIRQIRAALGGRCGGSPLYRNGAAAGIPLHLSGYGGFAGGYIAW